MNAEVEPGGEGQVAGSSGPDGHADGQAQRRDSYVDASHASNRDEATPVPQRLSVAQPPPVGRSFLGTHHSLKIPLQRERV